MIAAYYNEIDPFAAAWLRELIKAGQIAPGDVDERDIQDVRPDDLIGYTQCHFFAGIGVWSYSLRRAGWPDDKPVWTGSCPCQPFSAAGKGGGFADERHLWPAQFHLIRECRPIVWLGEQVASKDGLAWLDLVSTDLEAEGYAVGAVDTCSAGVTVEWEQSQANEWLQRTIRDCPDPRIADQLSDFADFACGNFGEGGSHIRQRLRIAAQRLGFANCSRSLARREGGEAVGYGHSTLTGSDFGRLADTAPELDDRSGVGRSGRRLEHSDSGTVGGMADGDDTGPQGRGSGRHGPGERTARSRGVELQEQPGPVNGFWRNADWLYCRDDKWRPVEPGTFPLAHGATARLGRLRGYGNAVDAEATRAFIEAVIEAV